LHQSASLEQSSAVLLTNVLAGINQSIHSSTTHTLHFQFLLKWLSFGENQDALSGHEYSTVKWCILQPQRTFLTLNILYLDTFFQIVRQNNAKKQHINATHGFPPAMLVRRGSNPGGCNRTVH